MRDAIAVFEQNKGKIVFNDDRPKRRCSPERPIRPLLRDNIYLQDNLKNKRNTVISSPSPPAGKGLVSQRIDSYSSVPRYRLDCKDPGKEVAEPSSPLPRVRHKEVTRIKSAPPYLVSDVVKRSFRSQY